MADLRCRVEIPPGPGLINDQLTVGRRFEIVCEGELTVEENEVPTAVLGPEQKYAIKILGIRPQDEKSFVIDVTSYSPGSHSFQPLMIKARGEDVSLGDLRYDVASVMDPQKPQEEPFGPMGPFMSAMPTGWLVGLGLAVLLLIVSVTSVIRRRIQKRKIRDHLREHDSSLSPLGQFHQTLRKLQRENILFAGGTAPPGEAKRIVQEVEAAFRLFYLRQFQVPADQWSVGALLSDLKKQKRKLYLKRKAEIKNLFGEFSLAKSSNKLEGKDAIQITETARKLSEHLEREGSQR